jgi:hypothetical protein
VVAGQRPSMRCVILAAGRGSRLAGGVGLKPLVPVLGLPLLERTIVTAAEAAGRRLGELVGFSHARPDGRVVRGGSAGDGSPRQQGRGAGDSAARIASAQSSSSVTSRPRRRASGSRSSSRIHSASSRVATNRATASR